MKPGIFARINRIWAGLLLLFLVAPVLVAIPVSLTSKVA